MNQSNVCVANFGRINLDTQSSEVLELLEDAVRQTISQFGANRVAMMFVSDDYLSAATLKAA